ncbi:MULTISPECIES: metallophosphoesterase [unclassified Meiothermus]|uniref:metallophosphoesterase family protein n=1 Tax=unclassified Meiothermus TaxID=370471 RepID=UPI000D7C51E9|nr:MULTISPECIES: metallophosphoesterase family protein [unclassified Meiothermus]PZA06293.1 metallophosphoesterase [Meiothermus sp. Pnk-1]RYM36380.1 metallophosphoesterase [Meiothermus sp. PNK-Is4]
MRLAILSDIHGNLPALEAVLADLEGLDADLVVVNGDLVNRGPANREVIERMWGLAQRDKLRFTLGNHDDLVLGWARRDPRLFELYDDPLFVSTGWVASQLQPEHLEWIAALPYQIHLEELGLRIAHGSPRHYREGYDERLPDTAIAEIVQEYPARTLVGSHTHRPYVRQQGGTLVLNSGAVGSPFNGDPRAQYMLLEISPEQTRWEFRQVPYDLEAALRAFHDSGLLEEGGLGAYLFYLELQTARSLLTPFWLWANAHQLPHDWEAWQLFQRAHPERFAQT